MYLTAPGAGPSLNGRLWREGVAADVPFVTATKVTSANPFCSLKAKIVAGYQPVMPTFQGLVTEEQILNLTAYIKSLQTQPVPAKGAGSRQHIGGRNSYEHRCSSTGKDNAGTSLSERDLRHPFVAAHRGPQAHRLALISLPSRSSFSLAVFFAMMIRLHLLTHSGYLLSAGHLTTACSRCMAWP